MLHTLNVAVKNADLRGKNTLLENSQKPHQKQTAGTVDNRTGHLFSYSSGGSPAAAFATAPPISLW